MDNRYDVIIIGGSYAGLSAAMALGRSLRNVLVIDSGEPCNAQTPHSHNFITQDGETPARIREIARMQVAKYNTVTFHNTRALMASSTGGGFTITTSNEQKHTDKRLLLATGIKDIMPGIPGFAECWGISVLHCPYCHGYEVRAQKTAVVGDGDVGYHVGMLLTNWTKDLQILTNGPHSFSAEQLKALQNNNISINEKKIGELMHNNGKVHTLGFTDGTQENISVIYHKPQFQQHSNIYEQLGCGLNEMGYLNVDMKQKTTVDGVYAAGDNTIMMRSVANAVAMGNMAGAMINAELIFG